LWNIEQYRASESEKVRTSDLLRLLPRERRSILDVGARDGHFSRLLAEYFAEVTALDLQKPTFQVPGVTTVAGDVTALQFADDSFDCVFCAEVLEHIPEVQRACKEIIRVVRHEIIIGVPFKQDIRVGRTTCSSCGRPNPPWGHVNSFDEGRILKLFSGLRVVSKSLVWRDDDATNALSAFLMDLAGNPWGTYGQQEEPCIYCGAALVAPTAKRGLWQRAAAWVAVRLNDIQRFVTRPHAHWIHVVFSKDL
jgi:SAM-dependent methyltransferase